jgi:branched-subunit amino acid aminotransferase/4-amino-4-deoxychorismate lyase
MAAAEEAFTSSSVRELMPIVRIDGSAVGDGRPGQAARSLQVALRSAAEG